MILIADSGSTKTDWAIADGGRARVVKTQGINPFHQGEDDIARIIGAELLPQLGQLAPSAIHFYGAGCNEEGAARVAACLARVFPEARVEVASDLLGAARALCGREAGVAAILGTGSNSCLYDGLRIVANVPPLGYILGDEGSGAALGRLFLGALYKGLLPDSVREAFERATGLSYADVLRRTYRQPLAGRFLASLAPAVKELGDGCGEVRQVVLDNFRAFLDRNVMRYASPLPLHAVGSIAFHFEAELREVAAERGVVVGRVLRAPIEGLVAHLNFEV